MSMKEDMNEKQIDYILKKFMSLSEKFEIKKLIGIKSKT